MNNKQMTASAGETSKTTLDDVIDEILMSDENLTGAKLNEWISRYPQFERELTDFAVNEATSEFIIESEPLTETKQKSFIEIVDKIIAARKQSQQARTN